MAKKVSLSDLLPAQPGASIAPAAEPAPTPAPATSSVETTPASTPTVPAPSTPRYDTFDRKEARLRSDQLDDLSRKARTLNRTKTTPGERITDNTLIRVAVDLLMSRSDELQGSNEDELRSSLGL